MVKKTRWKKNVVLGSSPLCRTKTKWIFLFFLNLFLFLLGTVFDKMLITSILILWMDLVLYCLDKFEERIVFLFFLASFFTFLIGREALCQLGFFPLDAEFTVDLDIEAEQILFISLSVVGISYVIHFRAEQRKGKGIDDIDYSSNAYNAIRKVSKYVFFISNFFNIYKTLDIVLFVKEFGYAEYYISYSSDIPFWVQKLGDIAPYSFLIYLATMPSKKDCRIVVPFYMLYLVTILGTGQRFSFLSGVLFIVIYFVSRNKVANDGTKWFTKREVIICVVALPAILIGMVLVNAMRFSNEVPFEHPWDGIATFFYEQGVSLKEIKRVRLYSSNLPKGKIYSLGALTQYLDRNFFSRLMGVHSFQGNTVEYALHGNSLAHILSYIVLGDEYLAGRGVGSCYIAEALHDLDYVGVILVNWIYGIVLSTISCYKNKKIWTCVICYTVLNAMLFAPRGNADGFLKNLIDLTLWGTIIFIWFFSKIYLNSIKKSSLNAKGKSNHFKRTVSRITLS